MKTRKGYMRLLKLIAITCSVAHIQKSLELLFSKPTMIIHLFLMTWDGKVILFRRVCNRWAPVAGKIERNETPGEAAFREVREETGITLDNIFTSPFTFEGRSRNGKWIAGQAHFAFLGKEFCLSEIKLKLDELVEYQVLPPDEALRLLVRQEGFRESYEGLTYILKNISRSQKLFPVGR
jgi:8-oxo-dGTP pyrophosphatase MutT (NUDIX family)